MPSTPERVADALRDALSVKAQVELKDVDGVPHAVVTGPSGIATWINLSTILAVRRGETATDVAADIRTIERWDALDLDQLLRELCAELGVCEAAWQKDKLAGMGPFSVEAFTDAVLEAEKLDARTSQWRGHVRTIVARHFGSCPE